MRSLLTILIAVSLVGATAVAATAAPRAVYVTNQQSGTVSQYSAGADGGLAPLVPPSVSAGGQFPPGIEETSTDQCKRGGWRTFPQFKNQGQCVAFRVPG